MTTHQCVCYFLLHQATLLVSSEEVGSATATFCEMYQRCLPFLLQQSNVGDAIAALAGNVTPIPKEGRMKSKKAVLP
jgi:hypothetical protein